MRRFSTRLFSFALPLLLADAGPRCGPRPERPVPVEPAPDARDAAPDASFADRPHERPA